MGEEKRYYWLKLKEDFFRQPRIKKLRKVAGGDTYTLIYLKMQLLSLQNGGILVYENIEDTFEEELSLIIDEDAENIRFTMLYLMDQGLMKEIESGEYEMPEVIQNTGSESASAERVRRYRAAKKALQCNAGVTACNTEKEIEKDIEIEIEIEKNNIVDSEIDEEFEELWKLYPNKQGKANAKKDYKKARKGKPEMFDTVRQGLENYLAHIQKTKTEPRYIKHGSTWFHQECWNDVYECETAKEEKPSDGWGKVGCWL